jgi:hypothetical protein
VGAKSGGDAICCGVIFAFRKGRSIGGLESEGYLIAEVILETGLSDPLRKKHLHILPAWGTRWLIKHK